MDIITLRCFGACVYQLCYPAFFLDAPKATLRKIFKWLFRFEWYEENKKAIAFFEQALPEMAQLVDANNRALIAAANKEWQECQEHYKRCWLDPNPATFPAKWDDGHKHAEKEYRKKRNAENLRLVKESKARYERAVKQADKDHDKAVEIRALYLAAKAEF